MEHLLEEICSLKDDFDKKRENDRFNVFTALHKERDEVNLHSRIISYLLSTTSGHGMNAEYVQIFVRDILNLKKEEFNLSQVIVLPNESKKSEYKEIDILIANKSKSQAIIIENKIGAEDSNHQDANFGYKGQLERYYNTIKCGIDKNGNECKEYQCNQVFVYYLSLNKKPSEISIGMLVNEPDSWKQENLLSYDMQIREWLGKCIQITPDEKVQVKNFIQHYLSLVNRITHNDIPMEERTKLKDIIAQNTVASKYFIDNFKHVKWHSVHEFWTELKNNLESQYDQVKFFSEDDNFEKAVERVTHRNEELNFGVVFYVRDQQVYISGLGKLSYGLVDTNLWSPFINETITDINFSDFSSDNTYSLINRNYMNNAVNRIIEEIIISKDCNFENLRTFTN